VNLVSFPVYVNLAHLFLSLSCFCPLPLLNFSRESLYLLLSRMCCMLSLSFCLFSGVGWYVFILL
jgi:hypothetical protein